MTNRRRLLWLPALAMACLLVPGGLVGAFQGGAATPARQSQQGVKEGPAGETVFTSPMVLTANFTLDQSLWGKGWFALDEHRELSKFTCDGVSLVGDFNRAKKTTESGLEFAVKVRADGYAELKIRMAFWNPPHNHDKSVTVVLEVLAGTVRVGGRTTVGTLDVEEGHAPQKGQHSFFVPVDVLRQPLTLRLNIAVTNRLEADHAFDLDTNVGTGALGLRHFESLDLRVN